MVWYLLWRTTAGSRDMEVRHTLRDALELAYRYLREGQDIIEIGEVGKAAVISAKEMRHLFGPAGGTKCAVSFAAASRVSKASKAASAKGQPRSGERRDQGIVG